MTKRINRWIAMACERLNLKNKWQVAKLYEIKNYDLDTFLQEDISLFLKKIAYRKKRFTKKHYQITLRQKDAQNRDYNKKKRK